MAAKYAVENHEVPEDGTYTAAKFDDANNGHKDFKEDGPMKIWSIWTKSHCLSLDLNGKRPGIVSDGNFSSYLIGRT